MSKKIRIDRLCAQFLNAAKEKVGGRRCRGGLIWKDDADQTRTLAAIEYAHGVPRIHVDHYTLYSRGKSISPSSQMQMIELTVAPDELLLCLDWAIAWPHEQALPPVDIGRYAEGWPRYYAWSVAGELAHQQPRIWSQNA